MRMRPLTKAKTASQTQRPRVVMFSSNVVICHNPIDKVDPNHFFANDCFTRLNTQTSCVKIPLLSTSTLTEVAMPQRHGWSTNQHVNIPPRSAKRTANQEIAG